MTLKITEDYFNNNLYSASDDFNLANGYYERVIPENELDFEFGTTDDGRCKGHYKGIKISV